MMVPQEALIRSDRNSSSSDAEARSDGSTHVPRGVSVLKSWNEVGNAIDFLNAQGYHLHRNPIKSWDLALIRNFVDDLARQELILDLGAGGLGAVRLLHEMGFTRVAGYDFEFNVFERLLQLRDWLGLMARMRRPTVIPYRLKRRDLLRTGLKSGCAGAIVCLSVIEHGVDVQSFFREAARLLKPSGRLYISTDYWDPKIDTGDRKMFGLPWTIFCRREIESLIEIGLASGFGIDSWNPDDLRCQEAVVRDGPHAYTFIGLSFVKHGA
jgi:SAM-dependent methyltransferase